MLTQYAAGRATRFAKKAALKRKAYVKKHFSKKPTNTHKTTTTYQPKSQKRPSQSLLQRKSPQKKVSPEATKKQATTKKCPNPHGRKGGTAHQEKVDQIKKAMEGRGLTVKQPVVRERRAKRGIEHSKDYKKYKQIHPDLEVKFHAYNKSKEDPTKPT